MKRVLSAVLVILIVLGCFQLPAVTVNGETEITRYSVLILDTSGSMSGTPSTAQKAAAIKFCTSVLAAEGTNYVAIVKLSTISSVGCDFTNDINVLSNYVNSIPASGGTNINQALEVSGNLLDNIGDTGENVIKNIVLCSDGLPESGSTTTTGPYISSDSYANYRYANYAYNTAITLHESYSVYTLGFFHSLSGSTLTFGQRFMNDIQNAGYYEVIDPEDLEFVFGEIADDIIKNNDVQEITFNYQSGSDYPATCYYSNNYFASSSYEYNASLATMSLSYAMSAFGSGNESSYSNKSVNARNLLIDIGVPEENIATNEMFTTKPTTDSIGVVVGNMPITVNKEKYTLIALAIRGGGYEQEWASNFTIGLTGQHDGFDAAKENVLAYLKSYISEQNITGAVKFWITGYSRAGATANLVGGALDSGTVVSADITYAYDDIYTYCFEPPAGALSSQVKNDAVYNNIFNIVNSSDPVPYVAPAALGFGRYGIDEYLPSAESSPSYTTEKKAMLEIYNSLPSTDSYVVDNFQMKKLAIKNWLPGGEKISFIQDDTDTDYPQSYFLLNYVTILSKEFIVSRSNYVSNYQDEIREICSVMFGCTEEQSKVLADSLVTQAKDNWGDLVKSYIWNVGINPCGTEGDALQIVSNWLKTAIDDAGITNYSEQTINRAGIYLADLLLALITNHPNYFTTLVMNIEGVGAAHFPELCFGWVASMDDNYTSNSSTSFNNGSCRIIRINCEVDIDVYDESGSIVASIANDVPQTIDGSSIISSINEDGEKIIVLPSNTSYSVKIIGRTNNDNVNYGINEYCALAGDYTRAINYFNIELNQGETLTGIVPAFSDYELENDTPNGSTANYTLTDPDGILINSNSDLNGDEATNAYYSVNVSSSNDSHGIALGSGIRQYGHFAQVEAIANNSYVFSGWYDGNTLVSSEEVYRFCVTEDADLVAMFESKPYIDGYEDGTFQPDDSISRAEVAQLLYNLSGETTAGTNKFSDISSDGWYYNAITYLTDAGVIDGYPDGTFRPDAEINRAEFVALVARYAGLATTEESSFPDVSSTHWAAGYIGAAKDAEYINGYPDGTFSPDGSTSRAEAVTVLNAMLGRTIDEDVLANLSMPFTDVPTTHWAYYQILEASVSH